MIRFPVTFRAYVGIFSYTLALSTGFGLLLVLVSLSAVEKDIPPLQIGIFLLLLAAGELFYRISVFKEERETRYIVGRDGFTISKKGGSFFYGYKNHIFSGDIVRGRDYRRYTLVILSSSGDKTEYRIYLDNDAFNRMLTHISEAAALSLTETPAS